MPVEGGVGVEMAFAPGEWIAKTREFWRETRSEMGKVSWPGKNEVLATTTVVLISVLFFGIYLWICDLAFYQAIDFIFQKFGV